MMGDMVLSSEEMVLGLYNMEALTFQLVLHMMEELALRVDMMIVGAQKVASKVDVLPLEVKVCNGLMSFEGPPFSYEEEVLIEGGGKAVLLYRLLLACDCEAQPLEEEEEEVLPMKKVVDDASEEAAGGAAALKKLDGGGYVLQPFEHQAVVGAAVKGTLVVVAAAGMQVLAAQMGDGGGSHLAASQSPHPSQHS